MSGEIYTREGDHGETSLVGGERVSKADRRVEAYGTLDEANAALGLARASIQARADETDRLAEILHFAQQRLMNSAANLATPAEVANSNTPGVSNADIERLEESIDHLMAESDKATGFVLPSGCEEAARLHLARTVTRRAERRLVDLAKEDEVDPLVMSFVNRLSDLLFAAARYANTVWGQGDEGWDPEDRA